jgi:hypothetical protein
MHIIFVGTWSHCKESLGINSYKLQEPLYCEVAATKHLEDSSGFLLADAERWRGIVFLNE